MGVISKQDLTVLGQYQFVSNETEPSGKNRKENGQLLCIRRGPDGERELSTVNSSDVTACNLFKKFFGLGKLANVDVSLKKISAYLSEKDLSQLDPQSAAYKTLHGIASRCLFYKKDTTDEGIARLWQKISRPLQIRLNEVRKEYSPRLGKDPYFTTLKESRISVFATEDATLNHLRVQAKIWIEKQGRSLWEKEAIEVVRPREWVDMGYSYDGPGRGYSYKGHSSYIPTLSGNREVSQVKLDELNLRAVTDIHVPSYLITERGHMHFMPPYSHHYARWI